jgi:hypothetical protein
MRASVQKTKLKLSRTKNHSARPGAQLVNVADIRAPHVRRSNPNALTDPLRPALARSPSPPRCRTGTAAAPRCRRCKSPSGPSLLDHQRAAGRLITNKYPPTRPTRPLYCGGQGSSRKKRGAAPSSSLAIARNSRLVAMRSSRRAFGGQCRIW